MNIESLTLALAERYRIERELGQGGMATVYLARDLKHDREVAIKVLREDLSASLGAGRFLREIKIAAQLQHPNILPLLDSGEARLNPERGEASATALFFVMPYIKGQSLRERLEREGELPVHDAVRLISEVVDALVEAHSHGVVHRDIKPDNVMLSGRHALVTDFGVAKAISEATGRNNVTTLGVAVGTPTYMSPEQAAADPHVDHRSDIYSVGVMAYEMLSGRPPFTGSTPQQVLAAHVTEAPDSVAKRRPAIPAAVEAVVMRCLAKRPADRFQTASELLAALEPFTTPSVGLTPTETAPTRAVARRVPVRAFAVAIVLMVAAAVAWWKFGSGRAGGSTIRTIAVLPFNNVGHDTAYDYLADGMANDIREALMQLPDLTVKARTSSEAERGKPIHDAGTLLHVGALLQGEFHRTAEHVTVTVDLVRTADETALWSHDYVLPADGNFSSAQDSITAGVANAVHLVVARGGPGTAGLRGTSDQQAYDLYLRGQYFFAKRVATNLNRAIDFFHQAIARDPKFARAYAGLARTEAILPSYEQVRSDSIVADGEAMARRALALDPDLAEAHVALAQSLANELRSGDAEPEFEAAIARDPRDANARQWHGDNLNILGRSDEAIQENLAATTLDPLSAIAYNDLAYTYLCAARYADAIAAGRRALELDPSFSYTLEYVGLAHAFLGQADSAAANFERMFQADSTFPTSRSFLVWRLALLTRWPDAEREAALIATTEPADSRDITIGMAQLALGNTPAALDALERAVRSSSFFVGQIALGCDPTFALVRNEPRFATIVKNAGQGMCNRTVKWPIPPRPQSAGE